MAKTHSGSIRCEVWLEQLNDLTQGAADAERRAQAAEKRNTEYSQEIADLRADYEKSDAALTLMLKHYQAAEATAKEERVRASEFAQQLEDAKQNLRGKDVFIGNLLKTQEQMRSHLSDAEGKIAKLERDQLQGGQRIRKLTKLLQDIQACKVTASELTELLCQNDEHDCCQPYSVVEPQEATEESVDTDCDSDSDWEPGCN